MPQFYKDLDFNLIEDPVTHDVFALIDEEAIKQSVINLVMTGKGEKAFESTIGTNVKKLLFSAPDQGMLFRLKRQIEFSIQNSEPRVTSVNAIVYTYPEKNTLVAKIGFTIIGSPKIIAVQVPLLGMR